MTPHGAGLVVKCDLSRTDLRSSSDRGGIKLDVQPENLKWIGDLLYYFRSEIQPIQPHEQRKSSDGTVEYIN